MTWTQMQTQNRIAQLERWLAEAEQERDRARRTVNALENEITELRAQIEATA